MHNSKQLKFREQLTPLVIPKDTTVTIPSYGSLNVKFNQRKLISFPQSPRYTSKLSEQQAAPESNSPLEEYCCEFSGQDISPLNKRYRYRM